MERLIGIELTTYSIHKTLQSLTTKTSPHSPPRWWQNKGVKALIGTPVCETVVEDTAAFIAIEAHFREKYGMELDASTKDPVRLCYVSYDPDAYVNWHPATALPVKLVEKAGGELMTRGEGASEHRKATGSGATAKHDKLAPETIKAMLACIPPCPGYDLWIKISSAVWAAPGDEPTGTALLKEWSPEKEAGESDRG